MIGYFLETVVRNIYCSIDEKRTSETHNQVSSFILFYHTD